VRPHVRGRQSGFSLLEAIVALTIFSICAMALYAWMSVNQTALVRIQARDAAVRDGRAALATLELVNPMSEPEGTRSLPGGLEVRWNGHEIVPAAPGTGAAGNLLAFDLALYELEVSAMRKGREVAHFTVRRAGWKTARTMRDEDF